MSARSAGSSYLYRVDVLTLKRAVAKLTDEQLTQFSSWFKEYLAQKWDAQIERDITAGRLGHLAERAERDFDAGRATPL